MYKNIAISGGIGVGTTTLMKNLHKHLEKEGWRARSTGQIVRDYTKENVLPTATLVSDEFDRKMEAEVERILKDQDKQIIEGWLAGFVSRNNPEVLRILVTCSDLSLRIDRVANRDSLTIEKAKEFIKEREEENFKKWRRLYGKYDFFDPSFFHVVIDTYSSGPMETVGKVLDALHRG